MRGDNLFRTTRIATICCLSFLSLFRVITAVCSAQADLERAKTDDATSVQKHGTDFGRIDKIRTISVVIMDRSFHYTPLPSTKHSTMAPGIRIGCAVSAAIGPMDPTVREGKKRKQREQYRGVVIASEPDQKWTVF